MRIFIRFFFKTLRILLGPFMLLWEVVSSPRGITRPADEQQRIDEETTKLALYQYSTCPFCIKVRRTIKQLSLNIEFRDVRRDPRHREALILGGGRVQVPCLRIDNDDKTSTWIYESDDINQYLQDHFS